MIHELLVEKVLNRDLAQVVHGERCAAGCGWVREQREVGVLSDLTLRLRLAEEYLHSKIIHLPRGIFWGSLRLRV